MLFKITLLFGFYLDFSYSPDDVDSNNYVINVSIFFSSSVDVFVVVRTDLSFLHVFIKFYSRDYSSKVSEEICSAFTYY